MQSVYVSPQQEDRETQKRFGKTLLDAPDSLVSMTINAQVII